MSYWIGWRPLDSISMGTIAEHRAGHARRAPTPPPAGHRTLPGPGVSRGTTRLDAGRGGDAGTPPLRC